MPDVDHPSEATRVGALFSTAATDNAEVVPPQAHPGPESMWSTAANATLDPEVEDGVLEGEVVDDRPPGAQDQGSPRPPNGSGWVGGGNSGAHIPPRFSGIFTAEPVERPDDVVDEADDVDVDSEPMSAGPDGRYPTGASAPPSTPAGEPLFSSSRTTTGPNPWTPAGPGQAQPSGGSRPSPFATPTAAPAPPPRNGAGPPPPPPPPPTRPPQPPPAPSQPHGHANGYGPVGLDGHLGRDDGTDPNGLRAAIARLAPDAVERTAVPIAVCGALLQTGESVLGAVTGQMLGRPAVVVLTNDRVLVVNDRRWQPIVDEFALDSNLVVRGRHDRNVAALSFADATRLAMIDGITEVGLAIELAERIRHAGTS